MKRSDEVFVSDILSAAAAIGTYTHGVSQSDFSHNREKQDAVIRQLSIVGEAASKLSHQFRMSHAAIPWREIIRMRNLVIHHYWIVDLDVVWEVVTKHLPALAKQLKP